MKFINRIKETLINKSPKVKNTKKELQDYGIPVDSIKLLSKQEINDIKVETDKGVNMPFTFSSFFIVRGPYEYPILMFHTLPYKIFYEKSKDGKEEEALLCYNYDIDGIFIKDKITTDIINHNIVSMSRNSILLGFKHLRKFIMDEKEIEDFLSFNINNMNKMGLPTIDTKKTINFNKKYANSFIYKKDKNYYLVKIKGEKK